EGERVQTEAPAEAREHAGVAEAVDVDPGHAARRHGGQRVVHADVRALGRALAVVGEDGDTRRGRGAGGHERAGRRAGPHARHATAPRAEAGAQTSLEAIDSHRYGPCSGSLHWLSRERVIESPGISPLERRVDVEAARAAGRLLRGELCSVRHIAYKGLPTTLVADMHHRAEAAIVGRRRGALPD